MRVAREHGEAVALANAEAEQAAAEPVADRIHLGKAPADIAAAHRELVRLTACGAAQEIADGMLARFRDGGCGVAGHFFPVEFSLGTKAASFRVSRNVVGGVSDVKLHAGKSKLPKTTPCTVDGGCKIKGLGGERDWVRVGPDFRSPKAEGSWFDSPVRLAQASRGELAAIVAAIPNDVSRDLLRRAKQEHSGIIAEGRTGRGLAAPFAGERVAVEAR